MSVSRTAIASRFSSSKISAGKFREQLSLRVFLLPKISAGKFREQLSLRVFLLPNVPPANFANSYRFAFFFFPTFRQQISRTAIASRFSSSQRSVSRLANRAYFPAALIAASVISFIRPNKSSAVLNTSPSLTRLFSLLKLFHDPVDVISLFPSGV